MALPTALLEAPKGVPMAGTSALLQSASPRAPRHLPGSQYLWCMLLSRWQVIHPTFPSGKSSDSVDGKRSTFLPKAQLQWRAPSVG